MRFALSKAAAWMAAALALPAAATLPASVADPDAPTRPLVHTPLPASGGVEKELHPWAQAHADVAAFPRGHADLVAWEKQQAPPTTPPGVHPSHGQPAAGGQP